jgi:hypothetical protein
MQKRMQKVIDTGKVIFANLLATAVTLADLLTIVQIISWSLAIAYTIWKWRREARGEIKRKDSAPLILVAGLLVLFSGCGLMEKSLFDRREKVLAVDGHTFTSPSGDYHAVPERLETNVYLSVKPSVATAVEAIKTVNDIANPTPTAPIISGVLTLGLAGLGWYARKNNRANSVLISAIEEANKPEVKAAVAKLAKDSGLSDFIHKKVENLTKGKK